MIKYILSLFRKPKPKPKKCKCEGCKCGKG